MEKEYIEPDIEFENKFLNDFILILKFYKPHLYNKISQTGFISSMIGKALGIKDPHYFLAGYYANIGLLAVDNFANKDKHLSDNEFSVVKRHPILASEYLKKKGLKLCATYAYFHHEKPDGSGYFKENDFPKEATYINIADVFQGCITYKRYRPSLTFEEATKETFKDYNNNLAVGKNEIKEIKKVLRDFYGTI